MYPHWLTIPGTGLQMGPQTVATLVATIIGVALGPWVASVLEGIPPRRALRTQLWLALAGLYGGHFLWVFNQWTYVWGRTTLVGPYELLAPWNGLHAPGAVIGMLLAGPWIFGRGGVPIGKFADLTTPLVGVCLAIVRIGCLIQGCCWGIRSDVPWGITFPPGSAPYESHRIHLLIPFGAPHSLPVHPLQLYFAAAALLVAGVALWLYPRKQYDGQVALVGLLMFSVSSTLLEMLREDFGYRVHVGPLPQLAWLWLLIGATALGGLLAGQLMLRRRDRTAVPA